MVKKLTVLHTESSLGWGGQEIRIFQESLRFTELGYKILIACQEGSEISRKAEMAGLPVFIVPMRFAGDPVAVSNFLRIIKSEDVDIIHTHSSKDSWIAGFAGRISGTPIVRSRHLTTPVKQNWAAAFVYRHLCDTIITTGKYIKESLVRDNKINSGKIISIPAGVDTARYDTHISGNTVRAELAIENAYPVVGVVAILRNWKGHQYLLEAVPAIVTSYPNAKFLIAGNGPQWDNLQRKIRDLGIEKYVIMMGFREDIPEILASLDIFILPSTASEATSQVIPQALAVGKPVIATNTGGLPEIIEDGITGLLIEPGNHEAIACAVVRMAENKEEAEKMAVRGREKILKGYTFQRMIDDTSGVYQNILKKAIKK